VPPIAEQPFAGLCKLWGQSQNGPFSVLLGVFQRLGMSPDGSVLVFEVTDDFSNVSDKQVPPDQEGIFVVHSDGSHLRRIGDASRNPCFRFDFASGRGDWEAVFPFNAGGSIITFTDFGPGPDGDAVQIFTMDAATGQRHQVTRLPDVDPPRGMAPTSYPSFVDDQTIAFFSYVNPVIKGEELNPENKRRIFTVKTSDPDSLQVVPFFAEPGNAAKIVKAFQISGPEPAARTLLVDGVPENGEGNSGYVIQEGFVLDEERVLQLTNFGRSDTSNVITSADRRRVLFIASADPFGANPSNGCQLFSIDRNGADLRQLTDFDVGEPSAGGCWVAGEPPGCLIISGTIGQDPITGSILFDSTCDPFGDNPNGSQTFALRPDGTGLRQVTDTLGFVEEADGTVTVELPGPGAIPLLPR
jgi:hypothetical protein